MRSHVLLQCQYSALCLAFIGSEQQYYGDKNTSPCSCDYMCVYQEIHPVKVPPLNYCDVSRLPAHSRYSCQHPGICYLSHVPTCVLSHFSHVWLFMTPWTVARQGPPSMGFSRQEYWSGLPCPSLGDLPNPGIEPTSLKSPALAGEFFTSEPSWKPIYIYMYTFMYITVWAFDIWFLSYWFPH